MESKNEEKSTIIESATFAQIADYKIRKLEGQIEELMIEIEKIEEMKERRGTNND